MSHITYDVVVKCYGAEPNFARDEERAVFFAVWAVLEREWAEALAAEIKIRDANVARAKESRRLARLDEANKVAALRSALNNYASNNPHHTQARKVIEGIRKLAHEYYKKANKYGSE